MELKLPVSDAAPYPALRIQGPSPVCVQAMLENIGSCHSEMTAIALYLYDSVLTRERWPKIAEYFHHIMIVEMRHLELFCQAAQLLGADPGSGAMPAGPPIGTPPAALTGRTCPRC